MNGVRYARTAGVHVGARRANKVKNRLKLRFSISSQTCVYSEPEKKHKALLHL